MGQDLLPTFGPPSRDDARATLERRGVDVRTGWTLREVTPTRVGLQLDGETEGSGRERSEPGGGVEELRAHTLIWAAGVRANPLAEALGVETTKGGRIVVGRDLRIPSLADAYAIGDVAAIPAGGDRDGNGDYLPGVAQVAIQSGKHAAVEILRSLRGEPGVAFRYHDKGSMATIGRRAAVAEFPNGFRLHGTPGWVAWLGLHLLYLIGFRNRLSVLVNWGWNYLTWDRGPRIIFGERPGHPSAKQAS